MPCRPVKKSREREHRPLGAARRKDRELTFLGTACGCRTMQYVVLVNFVQGSTFLIDGIPLSWCVAESPGWLRL